MSKLEAIKDFSHQFAAKTGELMQAGFNKTARFYCETEHYKRRVQDHNQRMQDIAKIKEVPILGRAIINTTMNNIRYAEMDKLSMLTLSAKTSSGLPPTIEEMQRFQNLITYINFSSQAVYVALIDNQEPAIALWEIVCDLLEDLDWKDEVFDGPKLQPIPNDDDDDDDDDDNVDAEKPRTKDEDREARAIDTILMLLESLGYKDESEKLSSVGIIPYLESFTAEGFKNRLIKSTIDFQTTYINLLIAMIGDSNFEQVKKERIETYLRYASYKEQFKRLALTMGRKTEYALGATMVSFIALFINGYSQLMAKEGNGIPIVKLFFCFVYFSFYLPLYYYKLSDLALTKFMAFDKLKELKAEGQILESELEAKDKAFLEQHTTQENS